MNVDELATRLDTLTAPLGTGPGNLGDVRRRMRRRQRRRAALAAVSGTVVVLAVALPLTVLHPSPSASPATTGVTALPTAPSPTTPTTSISLASCSLTSLRVAPGKSGAGASQVSFTIDFTNVGPHPCQLAGYPRVLGVTAAGTQAPVGHDGSTLPGTEHGPVVVQPGATAEALLFGTDNPPNAPEPCPPSYVSFVVQLSGETSTISIPGYIPFLGTDFPSCLPPTVSQFGAPGSFGGLDGVSPSVTSTPSFPAKCSPTRLRLGTPPGGPVVIPDGPSKVQINLSVINAGPACTAFGYPSLTLYGQDSVRLALPVVHGNTDTGNQPPTAVVLQPSQAANFVLDFVAIGAQASCTGLFTLKLPGTSSQVTLGGKTGGAQVCGTVHESAIYPPAY